VTCVPLHKQLVIQGEARQHVASGSYEAGTIELHVRLIRDWHFFLNPMHEALKSMKKRSRSGRPAKIAPLKPPKEIHDNTTPRCAMEATLSDHQMLELDESQEGLDSVRRLWNVGGWLGLAYKYDLLVAKGWWNI
jgi:hypothetical protein